MQEGITIDDVRELQGVDRKISIRLHQDELKRMRSRDKLEAIKESKRDYWRKKKLEAKEDDE